jgi:hypothetical protein
MCAELYAKGGGVVHEYGGARGGHCFVHGSITDRPRRAAAGVAGSLTAC